MIFVLKSESDFKKIRSQLSRQHPELKALFKRFPEYCFSQNKKRSPFESLVRAIAHQQLHGRAAETILSRMIQLFPRKKFPTPQDLIDLRPEVLRSCGFSNSKVKSIQDIAAKTISGVVPTQKSIVKMTNDEIVARLTDIYGVGRWTVEMLLIFQLGRLNVWPVDDFGVRRGFQLWRKKRLMPKAKDLKNVAAPWEPYQTVVALYLWQVANSAKEKN